MAPGPEQASGLQTDDDALKRYPEGAGAAVVPAAMRMMTSEYKLLSKAAGYRLSKELRAIALGLDTVGESSHMLDAGRSVAAWMGICADRFRFASYSSDSTIHRPFFVEGSGV